MRRLSVVLLPAFVVALFVFTVVSPLAAASSGRSAGTGASKPAFKPGGPVFVPRPHPTGGLTSALAGTPTLAAAPPVNADNVARRVASAGKRARSYKPAPALTPRTGRVIQAPPSLIVNSGRAKVNGQVDLGPHHPGAGPLLVPGPPSTQPRKLSGAKVPFTPSTFYSSTKIDNFSASCGFGVNETTIAQSTSNPNLLVAGANTYYDNSGNCQDSHAGVYYSSDGGQHWKFEVMPGLLFPSSGDPGVTFDPVRQVFVFTFVEFNRSDDSMGRIGAEVSSDGVNWSRNVTLDSSNSSDGVDKPSITVDQNPGSPHYGRVAVAWTEFFGNNAVYQEDYTDDGGASWHGSGSSVNFTNHECGNGTSEAFNANGELMVAWADCSGGVNSIYEELSTTGGASWTAPADVQITTTNPIEGADQNTAANCLLNNGGSAFRCNSFPTLAGDPNSGDAGGTAFVVGWADERSTTQNSQTATVSQIMGLSTINDGSTWDHLAFLNFNNFGDKFFPAASFSPNGRLTVSYSSREDDATSGNPNGKKFDEHQTEASSLTNLRAASYVTYTTDGTLGDPGSLAFIGDYSGNSSLDQNFDTFPIWTDVRSGLPSARTQDLCYADCFSFLSPNASQFVSRTTGSSFNDFWSFSMDPSTGSGSDFWNIVALRPASSSIDDDTFLAPNRYYSPSLVSSAFGAGTVDYTMVNGNAGHAPNTAYFQQVHNFSSSGGSYSIQWIPGHTVTGVSQSDSMAGSDVARVYDTFLSTGTLYYFGMRPAGGNTSIYNLDLHSANGSAEQARGFAVAAGGAAVAGGPAFAQYNTSSDPSAFDGVVAVNSNGGSGTYTLYRDTVVPTGSIKIDGGAASTNSTSASLTLSASNATAGDPVVDMAFSIDGGSFSAFEPFSTSKSLTIPTGDGTHTVAVEYRNGAGGVGTVTASIYLVQHAPTVTSVVPGGGPTTGGNTVTINGTNMAPGAKVKFGTANAAAVVFVSSTSLTAHAPANAAGTVDVTVQTPAGTSPTSSADRYVYGAPTVTGVVPGGGSTAGGNTVTINGTHFVSGATVKFGATAATGVVFFSATKLTAHAPAEPAGRVDVTVATPAGTSATSSADKYVYGVPVVASLSPAGGSTSGGNTVTVNGSHFVSGMTVKFGSTAGTPVTFVSATKIQVVAPAHAEGVVDVTVTSPAGTSATSSGDQYLYGKPTVTSVSPRGGSTSGGNTVTIHGTRFVTGTTVKFGSSAGTAVTFVSATELTVTAPPHAAGRVDITVTTPAGTSATSSADQYTYGIPTVSSISPTHGSTAGGTTVTINGSHFVSGVTVKFGTTAGTAVTFVSSTKITAKAPAHAAGTVHVTVTSPAGTSSTSSADQYTYS